MRLAMFGLLGMLLTGCLGAPEPTPAQTPAGDVIVAESAVNNIVADPDVETPEPASEESQIAENIPDSPSVAVTPEKPRRGLAKLFGRRKPRVSDAAPIEVEEAAVTTDDIASGSAEETEADEEKAATAPEPEARRPRKGLFGPRRTKASQFPQTDPDVMLPFGQIGSACGVRGKALGKEVDSIGRRGKGYKLYDTKPTQTGPRTHFLTGFKDGCPRQFTASLALLESPVLHEQLLSAVGDKAQHSTSADIAFQKIRAQVCRIGRGKACPEKHVEKMEQSMTFVTTYERFGGAARWTKILLHNGKVEANSLQE